MAEEIKMPQLGESVTEGTITKWLVKPGDKVNKYDPIAEVTTDKVNAEVPSSYSGTITEIVAKEDETVQVGELICYMDTAQITKETTKKTEDDASNPDPADNSSMKKRYSPAVMKLSQEHNIDLSKVEGTGRSGRITRKDLEHLIRSENVSETKAATKPVQEEDEISTPVYPTYKQKPGEKPEAGDQDTEIPLSGTRKAIAANMVKSKQEIPHAWTMVEADVTNLVSYRDKIKNDFKQKEGFSITFLPFFIKAVVEALKEFPEINSVWGGNKIIQKKGIHMSIAVGTNEALYVPVIKNADEKSIKGIAKEIDELVHKARSGKLSSEEMKGGTFTVNNTGTFGSVQSMPIINFPQAAILSVESINKKPVVMQGDMIAIRSMVNLCLSLDHRILDGLICGRFLARIKEKMENFDPASENIY
ncbi:dihydrolipoamide acetyltransferase family protein [Alteribacillus bidgolensis]|uniref:Dihydrolipoamide acetyltransferase component of pyruvate dehydrogenase complex n=1 Tax=Alteribacillus bidgolensis TaxID=930129 RepID=A0A1G8BU04_9BACI|nr:dihydrolipoamide acetyltransferase family protein [Alteribacillus bidgolensis]SDH36180.1 branched-chain alpha-keto acid dehydrogenase E2 component [Alteribacillus bidgolensis]